MSKANDNKNILNVPKFRMECIWVIVSLILYCTVFITLYTQLGGAIAAFAVLPVMLAAWFWGIRAGIISSILMVFINTFLFDIVCHDGLLHEKWWHELITHNGIPGAVAVLLIGVVVGYMRLLRKRLQNELQARIEAEKSLTQSNAEFEISEKRYRTLFDNAAEGILVAGIRTKKFKFANPAICRMLGYSHEELLQMDVSAIHPREALAHVMAEFEAQARGEKMLAEELPCLLKNGTVIYADVKAAPMLIDGETCNVGFFTDITERKRMENQARERMKKLQAFYGLSEIAGREDITLDKLYKEVTNLLPQSWQYPEIACARIVIGDSEYRTRNFMDSAWKQSAPVKVHKSVVGRIDVGYLEERPELDDGPFLKEERQLIDAIAERLGHIAERRRAEEMLLLKNIVFETSIAANSVADINGIINEANDAFLRVWGYSNKDEVIGKPLPHFFQKSEEAVAVITALNKSGRWVGEFSARRKDGSLFNAYGLATDIKDSTGKLIGYQSAVTDITERKMHQEQLERKNREILDITDVVTHDLKKPLAIMKTICSLFESESVCTLKDDGREAIAMGKDAIGYMHELLEDLLACAKLDAGTQTMEYEDIDFGEIVEMVLQRFKLQAQEKNIKISQNVSGIIHADRKGMTKLFMNLIGNAVNYIGNTPNPEIIINSSFQEADNNTLFSIKDNGIGIPADIQKDIFLKFKRGTNVAGISGTGLGLSIVKGIVEAHGGKIWLESKEGEGACFYFTVPAVVHEK